VSICDDRKIIHETENVYVNLALLTWRLFKPAFFR
jgi:hypothetical protein